MTTATKTKPTAVELKSLLEELGMIVSPAKAQTLVKRALRSADPVGWVRRYARQEGGEPSPEKPSEVESAEVSAADIVQANAWYTLGQISKLLGIPREVVQDAHRTGKFHEYKSDRAGVRVPGRRVIDWLVGHSIPHVLNADAVAGFLDRQAAAAAARAAKAAKAEAEKPSDVLEEAIDQARAAELARLQAEQAETDRAYRFYLAILLRKPGDAQGDDVQVLSDLMRRLELSGDDVRNDRELIRKAVRLEVNVDGADADRHEYKAALEAYEAMRERHAAEERTAFRRNMEMEGRCRRSSAAPNSLRLLARQRPEFFDGGNPPRLQKAEGKNQE